MFEGTITALVTPYREGKVDTKALRDLAEWQIQSGIHGLVVCGSTGEAANLSQEEKLVATREVVEQAKGRVPVIAGTGTNNTATTVALTQAAAKIKVDGVLVVTPYYVKPTQAGMIEHFKQVAAVGVPVIVYNVPGRTGISLTPDTVEKLCQIDKIAGMKEASGDLKLDAQMIRAARNRLRMLSGDDFTYLPFLSIGGVGCISVVSNVIPREMADLFNRFKAKDLEGAASTQLKYLPLMEAMFVESNPIPAKAALAMMGRISWEIRLPLTPLSASLRPQVEKILSETGLRVS
jgi:4-hydroxy-tetrahydrodipicolinate synthase